MVEIFEAAAKLKLRFASSVGQITVEDLWDLPLTATNGRPHLDEIGVALLNQLNDAPDTVVSLVKPVTDNGKKALLQLKFDIVKHIIDVKVEERDAAAKKAEAKAKRQQIMALINQRDNEELSSASKADLLKKLEELGDDE